MRRNKVKKENPPARLLGTMILLVLGLVVAYATLALGILFLVRRLVHLEDVRGVAGCGHIQNGKTGIPVAQGVQHSGDQIARVQRPSLAGLQIHLYAVLLPHR